MNVVGLKRGHASLRPCAVSIDTGVPPLDDTNHICASGIALVPLFGSMPSDDVFAGERL